MPAALAVVPKKVMKSGHGAQMKAHDAGIDDLDLLDVILQVLCAGALVALEAELDVLGGQRVAVVEFQVRPQT